MGFKGMPKGRANRLVSRVPVEIPLVRKRLGGSLALPGIPQVN